MPDSKISQLESANKIYDHDLMVVVTGYSTPGAYPDNCKISADRIRKDIVRLNEMIFFVSGFSGYYNTGENLFYITSHQQAGNLIRLDYPTEFPHSPQTISVTGLNATMGNNIEIQLSSGTPAAQKYGKIGEPFYSGIISVTGINARTENLLVRDVENIWPYSGIFYTTGLNAIRGNNIDIQFSSGSPASNRYGGVEGKYWSGIISTTGLNITTENLIAKDYETLWPYSGIVYTTGLNARAGNNIEITYSVTSSANAAHGGAGGKYYSGIISTTGINASAGSGIYLIQSDTWPFKNEIHSLEKFYEKTSNYNLYSNTNALDLDFPISISLPTGNNIKQLNSYSKIKVEGYYSRIVFDTHLPVPQPTRADVAWTNYTVITLKQGCAILGMTQPTRYSPLFAGGGIAAVASPLYDYSQEFSEPQPRPTTDSYGRGGAIICSNHTSPGTNSTTDMYNCHFLAFYDIPDIVTYPFQDIVGMVGVLNKNNFNQILPSCIVQWFGTEYATSNSVTETVSANGYINSITVYGHRFIETKPL